MIVVYSVSSGEVCNANIGSIDRASLDLCQCTMHAYACMNGHVNNIPTMQFSLDFPEKLCQNLIRYHWLSVSGNSKIEHCGGILINMPYRELYRNVFQESVRYRNIPKSWHKGRYMYIRFMICIAENWESRISDLRNMNPSVAFLLT